jgi:hypothetical protein
LRYEFQMDGSVRPALSAYAVTRRSSNRTSTLSSSMPTLWPHPLSVGARTAHQLCSLTSVCSV